MKGDLNTDAEVGHAPYSILQVLIATNSCEVYEVLDNDGTNLHKGPLIQGHFGYGVRGVATHPEDPDRFATAGADRTLRVWSKSARRMVSRQSRQTSHSIVAFAAAARFLGHLTLERLIWCIPRTASASSRANILVLQKQKSAM